MAPPIPIPKVRMFLMKPSPSRLVGMQPKAVLIPSLPFLVHFKLLRSVEFVFSLRSPIMVLFSFD